MVTLRLFQLVCAVIIIGISAWGSSFPLNSPSQRTQYSIRPNILSQSCTPRTLSAKKAIKSSTTFSTAPQKSKYGRNSSTRSSKSPHVSGSPSSPYAPLSHAPPTHTHTNASLSLHQGIWVIVTLLFLSLATKFRWRIASRALLIVLELLTMLLMMGAFVAVASLALKLEPICILLDAAAPELLVFARVCPFSKAYAVSSGLSW